MLVEAVILLILACILWACAFAAYAYCSWLTNSDLMGASVAFTSIWLCGAVLFTAALIVSFLGVVAALAIGVAMLILGKIIEWFLIEPLLHWMFKDYRSRPAT